MSYSKTEIRFFKTASGRCPVLEFVTSLSEDAQKQFWDAVVLLEEGNLLAMPLSRPLPNIYHGLHELRLKDSGGIYRVFYFIKVKNIIYMLHGLRKKTQQLPKQEIQLVRKRIKEI